MTKSDKICLYYFLFLKDVTYHWRTYISIVEFLTESVTIISNWKACYRPSLTHNPRSEIGLLFCFTILSLVFWLLFLCTITFLMTDINNMVCCLNNKNTGASDYGLDRSSILQWSWQLMGVEFCVQKERKDPGRQRIMCVTVRGRWGAEPAAARWRHRDQHTAAESKLHQHRLHTLLLRGALSYRVFRSLPEEWAVRSQHLVSTLLLTGQTRSEPSGAASPEEESLTCAGELHSSRCFWSRLFRHYRKQEVNI